MTWRDQLKASVEHTSTQPIATFDAIDLYGTSTVWSDSGVDLSAGETFTVLAQGRMVLSSELDLSFGPATHLWLRIGEGGEIRKAIRPAGTHGADQAGRLFLGLFPGAWLDRKGSFEGAMPLAGRFEIALLRWRVDPEDGLRILAAGLRNDSLIMDERNRLERPITLPAGWEPLWHIGDSDVFDVIFEDERAVIRARPNDDLGIICHRIAVELTDDTRLRWQWRYRRLPATNAENQFHTHDYISIAVEFDDGQDLTYYWSAALPKGTSYRCPLPWWDQRETHMVLRSGDDELERWHQEERNLYDDYRDVIGGPARAIVAVWLIGVSVFTHSTGEASFTDIAVVEHGRTHVIGPFTD